MSFVTQSCMKPAVGHTQRWLPAVPSFDPFVAPADRYLVRLEARPSASLRLFCFPWSGATASVYRELASTLPDEIETVAVQLPGRSSRRDEAPLDELAPLARQAVKAIDTELHERPGRFALFGHSLGALLAYEVARLLVAAGQYPDLVVMSASRAPVQAPRIVLHKLGDAELLAALGQMGGTSSDRLRDQEFLGYFLPLVRTDLTAYETFQPAMGAILSCPVSVWAGREDWYAHPEDVNRWRELVGLAYRSRLFDGGHFFNSDVATVATAVLADLRWSNGFQDDSVAHRQPA
jgi:surfactin synthase thioesterase subunit